LSGDLLFSSQTIKSTLTRHSIEQIKVAGAEFKVI